ncbi:acyl-CoA thioesterase [Novosphingobium colocasiae]
MAPTFVTGGRYDGIAILGGDGVAFGGHCAAQSLCAAAAQAGRDRLPNSIHSTFLSAVVPDEPVSYEVTWLKQGRAFSVLRVDARQRQRVCLTSVISFHVDEHGPSHQIIAPEVALPELCRSLDFIPPGTNPEVRSCFDIREAAPAQADPAGHPAQTCWLRCRQPLGDDGHAHAGALVWFSDLSMPWTADLPYLGTGPRIGASLDHSLWFHRRFSVDDWLMFVQESPIYVGARAFTRGMFFFTQDGKLVATAAQETLVRRPGATP